jgi:hypothetical protein
MFTGDQPFSDLEPYDAASQVAFKGVTPEIPSECNDEFSALLKSCFSSSAADRPDFTSILSSLQAMSI